MEFRWDGPAQVKNLGDSPSKSAINALFAIPGDTKSDSSLPHHSVSSDGTVGAADEQGCIAAIGALNGGRGGVNASAAEKNRAYSHLASHLRAMGVDPPEKQFAAVRDVELRSQRRGGMLHVPERLSLAFGAAGIEMRAKANGTGGTSFQFDGYAAVFDHPFDMWDYWGDAFTEVVRYGAFTRTLANNCDVPFLIGHNDAGIPMARTKSGTMTLGQDTHGLHVHIPALDGSRDDVRALASAHERGDMDEMSCAFICRQQEWSPDWETRALLEMDLHKGDVSAVVFGANDGTAGSSVVALPAEQLLLRRPVGLRQQRAAALHAPLSGAHSHAHSSYGDGDGDADDQAHSHMHVHNNDANHAHSHDHLAAGQPHEHRDGGGEPDDDTPDYDPQQHSLPGHIQCPSADCTVDGGAMNGPDAKFCDQCGAGLYSEDGTIIIGEDGVPVEIAGDTVTGMNLSAARAGLELRQRQLALLTAGAA